MGLVRAYQLLGISVEAGLQNPRTKHCDDAELVFQRHLQSKDQDHWEHENQAVRHYVDPCWCNNEDVDRNAFPRHGGIPNLPARYTLENIDPEIGKIEG